MKRVTILAATATLAACATTGDGASASGFCGVERLGELRGRPASQELGAEALRLSNARVLRWIRPGDIVTMDFREDRLNVDLDAQGRVSGFRCG